jgi:hypothetical protein
MEHKAVMVVIIVRNFDHEEESSMEEIDLLLEEKNVLLKQMIQMKALEKHAEGEGALQPRQIDELRLNIDGGEQRLWELDRILDDLSRHRNNPDD